MLATPRANRFRWFLFLLCAGLGVSPSMALAGSLTGYIKIPDIDGDMVVPRYEGWSKLSAMQIDVGREDPMSGRIGGTPTIAVSFAMEADSSYPLLSLAVLQGEVFENLRVHQVNDDGGVVLEHLFENVSLGSIRLTETASGARIVGELGRIDYYETTYRLFGEDGALRKEVRTGYDFEGGIAAASARLAGDYNGDGLVNQADNERWADQYGVQMVTIGGGADGNADGRVDAADYTIWRNQHLNGSGGGAGPLGGNPIPEPATAALVGVALAWAGGRRRTNCPVGSPRT